ncbi:exodeoxyribonuclease VII small subunit [Gephyromycinifex aptenodytis]|uniref:exodeoxyribonuclease VII small subunit n=1 Tax=Gephyromycinifex aptenodytis TaxID=2716227 RepID=UPI0014485654|nr:exodeoxyribonuclease VII small subunit [Gephyromycinifex aptenodytis]
MSDEQSKAPADGESSSENTAKARASKADVPAAPGRFPDIAALSYEAARDELVDVVSALERGQADLEQSVNLWERGEALAAHCTGLLDRATARLDAAAHHADQE